MLKFFVIFLTVFLLSSCTEKTSSPIRIAMNPWPGYEFLYLAEQKGFYKEQGLDVTIVQVDSLADAKRAYVNGFVDGMASTLIEMVQSQILSPEPLNLVLITDYSNGGDVVISEKSYQSIAELKGKKIGCEVSSLGIFVLQRALAKYGMSIDDVEVVNTEQSRGKNALEEGKIDAFVTYPPTSIDILRSENYTKIFTSAEIPNEIVDVVSLSKKSISENPNLVTSLQKAWDQALAYFENNKEDAVKIMSDRQGITSEEFLEVLGDLVVLDSKEQSILFSNPESFQKIVLDTCNTLVKTDSLKTNCDTFPNVMYSAK